jgi:hypothetical protein
LAGSPEIELNLCIAHCYTLELSRPEDKTKQVEDLLFRLSRTQTASTALLLLTGGNRQMP